MELSDERREAIERSFETLAGVDACSLYDRGVVDGLDLDDIRSYLVRIQFGERAFYFIVANDVWDNARAVHIGPDNADLVYSSILRYSPELN